MFHPDYLRTIETNTVFKHILYKTPYLLLLNILSLSLFLQMEKNIKISQQIGKSVNFKYFPILNNTRNAMKFARLNNETDF